MKIVLIIIAAIVGLVILIVGGGYIYLTSSFPNVGDPADITVSSTSELIERGRYLANNVCGCIDCHSDRDWNKFSGPIVLGTEGKGGFRFDENSGFPGIFYAKNITPAALANWTDGELRRAITCGVSRDGKPIFPVMPYIYFGKMAESDADAITAYLRTMKPIVNEVPESHPNFPMSLIVRLIPKPAEPQPRPDSTDIIAHGRYLATIAACVDCHTPMVKGRPVDSLQYAGGREFEFPAFVTRSFNITPDEETGIGAWDRQDFIDKFRIYDLKTSTPAEVGAEGFNTPMPWTIFAGMSDHDLGAIYTYLKTLKPIKNQVEKFAPRR